MTSIDAVQHRFEAQALSVCHVGPDTALRFQLKGQSKSIVVLLATDTFLEKKNARADDNLVPWPPEKKGTIELFECPPPAEQSGGYNERRKANMERAWSLYKSDFSRSTASIAREISEQDSEMLRYFKTRHADDFSRVHSLRAKVHNRYSARGIADSVYEAAFDEYVRGGVQQKELAARIGVSPPTISNAFTRIRSRRASATKVSIPA